MYEQDVQSMGGLDILSTLAERWPLVGILPVYIPLSRQKDDAGLRAQGFRYLSCMELG